MREFTAPKVEMQQTKHGKIWIEEIDVKVYPDTSTKRVDLIHHEDLSDVEVCITWQTSDGHATCLKVNFHIEPWARAFAISEARFINAFVATTSQPRDEEGNVISYYHRYDV